MVHSVPWHEGVTCAEYDGLDSQVERLKESVATAQLLAKRNVKICPHCKQGAEKTGGCNRMSCEIPSPIISLFLFFFCLLLL